MRLSEVKEALGKAAPALSSDGFVPALSNFRFEDGWVTAYKMDVGISVPLDLGLDCLVPGKSLLKIVKLAPSGSENVEFIADKTQVQIRIDGKVSASLSIPEDVSYPDVRFPDDAEWKPVPEGFKEGLEVCLSTNFFGAGSLRYRGFLLQKDFLAATDGNGLTCWKLDAKQDWDFFLFYWIVREVVRFGQPSEWTADENRVGFRYPDGAQIVGAFSASAAFPQNWKEFFPSEPEELQFLVLREEDYKSIKDTVHRACRVIGKTPTIPKTTIAFAPDEVKVSISDERVRFAETIEVSGEGPSFTVKLAGPSIVEALSYCDKLTLLKGSQDLLFLTSDDGKFRRVIACSTNE